MILTCCCLQGFWETGPCSPFYTNRQNCPSWSASFDMQFDLWLPPPFLWLLPRRDDDLNELGEAEQPRVISLTTQLPRILCSFTTLTTFPPITGQEKLDWPIMNSVFVLGSLENKGSNVLGKSWPHIVRGWGSWKSNNSNCRKIQRPPLKLGFRWYSLEVSRLSLAAPRCYQIHCSIELRLYINVICTLDEYKNGYVARDQLLYALWWRPGYPRGLESDQCGLLYRLHYRESSELTCAERNFWAICRSLVV